MTTHELIGLLAVVVVPHASASVLDRLQRIGAPHAEPLVQPAENRGPVTSATFG